MYLCARFWAHVATTIELGLSDAASLPTLAKSLHSEQDSNCLPDMLTASRDMLTPSLLPTLQASGAAALSRCAWPFALVAATIWSLPRHSAAKALSQRRWTMTMLWRRTRMTLCH